MEKFVKVVGIVTVGIITVGILSILFAFPVKWLWNWLMPVIFELPKITMWQAWGLLTLSGFLLKSTVNNKT